MKILLVEDDPGQAAIILMKLKRKADQVDHAEDGPVAVSMANTEYAAGVPYDLIIMDIGLPVFDGIEASRKILANNPATKIVALSANYSSHRESCEATGMLGGVEKPLTREKMELIFSQFI